MSTGPDRVYTSESLPGEVLVFLTHPRSNDGTRTIHLKVEEQMSGMTVLEIAMTPEQFADVLASTGTNIPGARLPQHPERLGKRMQTASTALPRTDPRDPEQVVAAYLADGWETASSRATNYGHLVVARRWIADEAEAPSLGIIKEA
jgi:hypothetical protein